MSARKRKQHLTTLEDVELDIGNFSKLKDTLKNGTGMEHGVKNNKENKIKSMKKGALSDSDTEDENLLRALKARGVKVGTKRLKSETRKQLFTDLSQRNHTYISKRKCSYSPDRAHVSACKSHESSVCNNEISKTCEKVRGFSQKSCEVDKFEESRCEKFSDSKLQSETSEALRTKKRVCSRMDLTVASENVLKDVNTLTKHKQSSTLVQKDSEEANKCLVNARTLLHASSVPSCLPCRDAEYQNILNFVERKVCDQVGGCMYISGVPGTGKTATVTQVLSHLHFLASKGDLPKFNSVEINGMRLSDPKQAYVQLYQKIFARKDRVSADIALTKLEAYFNKNDKSKTSTVIVVDELDLLCTRKQEVVYNLLEWPSKPNSRLVVLTIANTMDMPERKLKGKINSRLGLTRLTFLPYTHKQLEEIVLNRLEGSEAFVIDAVRLATRKVAAVSGDCRRALDICRRAAELPIKGEPVRIFHIEKAIKEMTNSNVACHIRACSNMEKKFLRAVSEVCLRTGVDEVIFEDVANQMVSTCLLDGCLKPAMPALMELCQRLRCYRFLLTNDFRAGLLQRITLNVSQDDLYYGLKDVDRLNNEG